MSSTISKRKESISPLYSKWTVHTKNVQWFGNVQASVAKCRWLGCSWSNLVIQSWHFLKATLMSFEMVLFKGRLMLGLPAVNRSCNSLSLTILTGQLLLVTHFTRCALFWWWAEVYVNNNQYIYQNFGLVWTQCEYLTGCLPFYAKSGQIELLHSGACLPASVALTTSLPKQWSAWCLRLAVGAWSFKSWKWWMVFVCDLHLKAAQVKTWHGQPSWYWKVTSNLKNV